MDIRNDVDLSTLQNKNTNDEFIRPTQKSKLRSRARPSVMNQEPEQRQEQVPHYQQFIQQKMMEDKINEKLQMKQREQERIDLLEEEDYKRKMIQKIKQYNDVFYEFLTDINLMKLESKSTNELEAILSSIRDIVSSRNIGSNVNALIQTAPYLIETAGKRYGLELDGYAQFINSDKNYYYTVQEILIENNIIENIKVNPLIKLPYILGFGAYHIHMMNRAKKSNLDSKLNSTIDPTKYNDL